jgi:hypothetical protein
MISPYFTRLFKNSLKYWSARLRPIAVKAGLLVAALYFEGPAVAQVFEYDVEFDQGWTAEKRGLWYGASQGSRLIPLDWLRVLEQPGTSGGKFMDPAYVAQFGYLPEKVDGVDLAIGFAIDRFDDTELVRTKLQWKPGQESTERWVGMNCAACHTAQLNYKGKTLRIDGGPAAADFQNFVEAMEAALKETLSEPKWSRFAAQVLGPSADDQQRGILRGALQQLTDWQTKELAANEVPLRYGYGRVDAFGHIFNKVALLLNEDAPKTNPSDAPVSIPFIWRAPQLDRVQYNGIAPKIPVFLGTTDLGALVRNTGEVIGVFGDINLKGTPGPNGYPSSISIYNLTALENQLKTLRPPKWPESLFGFNQKLADIGAVHYQKHCSGCHEVIDRADLQTRIPAKMNLFDPAGGRTAEERARPAPGTDPWMACNAYDYSGPSGQMKGAYFGWIGEKEPMSTLLAGTVGGALLGQKMNITKEVAAQFFHMPRPPKVERMNPASVASVKRTPQRSLQLERCMTRRSPNLGYTSRPLNGIWATAPYLHNGSVASLYELLLPPSERRISFVVGSREFDPLNVGVVVGNGETAEIVQSGNRFTFNARDENNVPIDGNSNEGHDYDNKSLTREERMAIIEYLKSL